jgi:hypothetical protein
MTKNVFGSPNFDLGTHYHETDLKIVSFKSHIKEVLKNQKF